MWVPLARTTAWAGATRSSSARVGSRFSANLFSLAETQATKIHAPSGVRFALAAMFSSTCATDAVPGNRASTHSSFR